MANNGIQSVETFPRLLELYWGNLICKQVMSRSEYELPPLESGGELESGTEL